MLLIRYSDDAEANASLSRAKRICRIIGYVFKVVLLVLCLYWIAAITLMAYSLVGDESRVAFNAKALFEVALYILYDCAIAMIFVSFIKMFESVSRGESPFSMDQVKRLRLIAVLLLACGLAELATSANTAFLQSSIVDAAYFSTSGNVVLPVNFGPFVASAAIFAFSFVFKYGVLLQEFTDETL